MICKWMFINNKFIKKLRGNRIVKLVKIWKIIIKGIWVILYFINKL